MQDSMFQNRIYKLIAQGQKFISYFANKQHVTNESQTISVTKKQKCHSFGMKNIQVVFESGYFNRRNFHERNFRESENSRNPRDTFSRIDESKRFREINFRECLFLELF